MSSSETKRYGHLLRDEKPEVRLDALNDLTHIGPTVSDLLPTLWHIALHDLSLDVRSKACEAIWTIEGDKQSLINQIREILTGEDPTKKRAVLQFLTIVEMDNPDIRALTEHVWKLLQTEDGEELDMECLEALLKAGPDRELILEKLLSDKHITTKRKIPLLTSALFRTEFQRVVNNEPDRFLPWIVELLRAGSQIGRTGLIDWMILIYPDLPSRWRLVLKEELWQIVIFYCRGFGPYCLLEGQDKAMKRLVNDPAIPQENIGAVLLADAPPTLLQTSLANNTYQTTTYILEAMVHPDWTVRQSAVRWIEKNGAELSSDLYEQCVGSLERRIREDVRLEVQISAEKALASLIQGRRSGNLLRQGKLVQMIGDDEPDVDAKIKALESLARMESLDAMTAVVSQWLLWSSVPNCSLLVDLTENLMRRSKYAVLPLLQSLDLPFNQRVDHDFPGDTPGNGEETNNRHIYRLLAEMSDERFFNGEVRVYESVSNELRLHAVPVLAARLNEETEIDSREYIARLLAYTGGHQAVSAISEALTGEERSRSFRQNMLSTYYLAPSKRQSEQAAFMLEDAISESKRTMRVLQGANLLVFVLGIAVMGVSLAAALLGDETASRIIGIIAASGSLGGLLFQLTHNPIDRIQKSISEMVQIETVFTSFVWELNLCSTYIQSMYVASGILSDDAVAKTVGRIEQAAEQAVKMIRYSDEDGSRQRAE